MEFFLELIFTIPFSFIVSFCIAKFLSIATTDDHDFTKNKTTHFEEESKGYNLERVGPNCSTIGASVDDQSPELFNLGVKKTEEKSLDEAQKTETEMGFKKEEVVIDEIEETKLGFGSNFANLGDFIEYQSVELFNLGVEKTEENSLDVAQNTETEMGFIKEELGIEENKEISENWEGIERSELDKLFGAAVAYVDSNKGKNSKFSSDLKLQLFGLYQVAMAGPCLLPKPMALNLSARAKWNAWQQLGNMSSEAAMEHYINLLSMNFPGWMEGQSREDDKYDHKIMHL